MLIKRIFNVWKNYIGSQFLVTKFVFLMNLIAGWATGLRFPFVNALAAGICELIPEFGSVISWVITAVLALVFGSSNLQHFDPMSGKLAHQPVDHREKAGTSSPDRLFRSACCFRDLWILGNDPCGTGHGFTERSEEIFRGTQDRETG